MKRLICALLLLVHAAAGYAQFTTGQVLTAAQLNSALAAPTILGGSINGAPIGQNNPNSGAFTTLNVSGSATFSVPLGTTNGGTGLASMPSHGVVIGAGASSPTFAMPGTANYAMLSNGSTSDPSFQQLTAPIVSYTPSGTGAAVTTVKAFLDSFLQYPSGQFYQNAGAKVNRIRDRLFVGPAADNLGTNVASQPDWLTQYQLAKGRTYGYVQTSQMAVLNGPASQDSLTTAVFGAQTSGRTASGSQVIATTGVGVNNNSGNIGASGNQAWGGYFEGWRDTATAGNGGAYGIEADSINLVGVADTDPYVQSSDQTISAQLASGGEIVGAFDSTAAINIQNNGSAYRKGIVFGSNSITGATGSSGTGIAIALGKGHELQWYGAASTPTSSILGIGTTTAGGVSQQFSDNLVQWMNSANGPIFGASGTSGSANYILASNATSGNAPAFAAQGTDANISIAIAGKGTGGALLQGGTSGTAAPAGYMGQVVGSDVPAPGSSVTSAAIANVTSASVPAGNWMCYGNVQQIPGASTAIGQNAAWISTTSAALPSALENSGYAKRVTTASATATIEGMNVGPVFYGFTSSTTVYLSSQVNYSSGTTGTQYGALNCVRFH